MEKNKHDDLYNSDIETKLSIMSSTKKFNFREVAKYILKNGEKFPKLDTRKLISDMTPREKVIQAMRYTVEKWIDSGKKK